jgi:hypothetical protein
VVSTESADRGLVLEGVVKPALDLVSATVLNGEFGEQLRADTAPERPELLQATPENGIGHQRRRLCAGRRSAIYSGVVCFRGRPSFPGRALSLWEHVGPALFVGGFL